MTSDEIKKCLQAETETGKPESLPVAMPLWEIAWQLAVMNERQNAIRLGGRPEMDQRSYQQTPPGRDHAGHKWVDGRCVRCELSTMEAIGKLCWPKSPRGGQGNP